MKKTMLLAALVAVLGAYSHAEECVIPKLDLDKVPFPIAGANTKFELADGETYVLKGTVVKREGSLFFKIDFNAQPWLATAYRLQNPFLAIEVATPEILAKAGTGQSVQLAVVLRRLIQISTAETAGKSDIIQVIAPPLKSE